MYVMASALEDCTLEQQRSVSRSLVAEDIKPVKYFLECLWNMETVVWKTNDF